MIRGCVVCMMLLSVAIGGAATNLVLAETSKSSASFQEEAERGFTSISTAVGQFERTYQKKVNVPTEFPFDFTQKRGRMISGQNKLEIRYFNKDTNEILLLFVEPMTSPLKPYKIDKVVTLKDGTQGYYRVKHPGFYQLDFQRTGLTYRLWIGTNTKKVITSDTLINIANSMQ